MLAKDTEKEPFWRGQNASRGLYCRHSQNQAAVSLQNVGAVSGGKTAEKQIKIRTEVCVTTEASSFKVMCDLDQNNFVEGAGM